MEKHFPEDLKYTEDHEWCRVHDDIATIGITWHAQDQLGDVVFCELPEIGEEVSGGQSFGVVESTKAASDLISPVTGKVVERNEDIIEAPQGLNDDMYGDGWLIRVQMSDPGEVAKLMDHATYANYVEQETE